MTVKRINIPVEANKITLLAYKDLIASFFIKNYPTIDPDKYWNWFLRELLQRNLDINQLKPDDLNDFLNQLTDLGDRLLALESVNPNVNH